jgi:hypothetical protein
MDDPLSTNCKRDTTRAPRRAVFGICCIYLLLMHIMTDGQGVSVMGEGSLVRSKGFIKGW